MKTTHQFAALLCAAALLGACTTMGTGSGSVSPGNEPVKFSWKSTDGGISGTMSAALDVQTFSGPYHQITKEVRMNDLDPMWSGWQYGWNDWAGWEPFPPIGYATQYSGRVLANLKAADGQMMRCRFSLNHPADGMGGGGTGTCQLKTGRSVEAVFPAA